MLKVVSMVVTGPESGSVNLLLLCLKLFSCVRPLARNSVIRKPVIHIVLFLMEYSSSFLVSENNFSVLSVLSVSDRTDTSLFLPLCRAFLFVFLQPFRQFLSKLIKMPLLSFACMPFYKFS